MSENDNLTVGQLAKSVERLADAVESHFEAGDTKTATLARIAQNQANISRQFDDHRHAIERRFDSLERDIAEIRKHEVEPLKTDVSDHKKRIRGNGTDGIEKTVETLKRAYDSWVKWRAIALTALVVAVVGNTFVLVWSRLTAPQLPPQKTLTEQLDDEATRKKLKEILAPPQTATEPKPEPKPEKPRNSTRRRPMPPTSQTPMLANDKEDRIASGRMPMFTLSDGKVSESRRLARP